jgi:hypothetical protein
MGERHGIGMSSNASQTEFDLRLFRVIVAHELGSGIIRPAISSKVRKQIGNSPWRKSDAVAVGLTARIRRRRFGAVSETIPVSYKGYDVEG